MSIVEAPPAIAGVDGTDQAAADLQTKLEELDAIIWADREFSANEQRVFSAWMYMQKQKIMAFTQQQAAGAGQQFAPQQAVPGQVEEPLTAGTPGAGGGDSGYEEYRP